MQNSQPPELPPPVRRALAGHEKVILGAVSAGLLIVATAIFALPAPGNDVALLIPTVAVASLPIPVAPAASVQLPDSIATAVVTDSATPVPAPVPAAASQQAASMAKRDTVKPPKVVPKKPKREVASAPPPTVGSTPAPANPAPADTRNRRAAPQCEALFKAQAWREAFAACNAEESSEGAATQRRLAMLYQSGHGTNRSDDQASRFFLRAANAGDAESMFQYANALERGRGVQKNQTEALRWYTRAADAEHAGAQYFLGQVYERGKLGEKKDKSRAVTWYGKAAAQGYSDAAKKVRDLSK